MKYRPGFPDRFGSIQDVRAFCQDFFSWYNTDHRHTGIGLLTPGMVHYGKAEAVIGQRRIVLSTAFDAHPERLVRGLPVPPQLPEAAWINNQKAESNHVTLAEQTAIPGVVGDEPSEDRRSWGILEPGFLNQAGKADGNDTKFEIEVSHNH